MKSKEEFEVMINELRDKMDDTTRGKISDDLLGVVSNYNNAVDEIEKLTGENATLKNDKDELLKVNGKLFQKIGFEKEESEEKKEEKKKEDVISIEDIIDEKGEWK